MNKFLKFIEWSLYYMFEIILSAVVLFVMLFVLYSIWK